MTELGRRKKIGDLLLEAKLITPENLELAMKKQKATGKKLGDILVGLGYVSDEDFIKLLELQLGIPYKRPDATNIDPEAVNLVSESLARHYELIPLKLEGNALYIAMSDPLNIYALDDISLTTGYNVVPSIARGEEIRKAISIYYGNRQAMEAAEEYRKTYGIEDNPAHEQELVDEAISSAPIVKMLNSIIEQAARTKASDVHIEPMEHEFRVRFRRDGQMNEIMRHDMQIFPAISTRIKIISGMNIAERRKPQDGRVSTTVDSRIYDLRVSCIPTVFGEKIVFRIIDSGALLQPKSRLLTFKDDLAKYDTILKNTNGVVLITGPTGSGKSTTLYTTINELNSGSVNIVTVEDPVEAIIEGVNQIQVNTKAGVDFGAALRSILRQDPDIIVVGEIRDTETAEIAVRAAVTGHLVVSTLHTNDAPSTISRLLDMNIEPFLISTSLVGVVAQRLVRRICPDCIEEYFATPDELQILRSHAEEEIILRRGKGCGACNGTGYAGRTGVFEILSVTPAIRKLINDGASTENIKELAVAEGMNTLYTSASRLVRAGITTVSELVRVAYTS